jgi:hypothetical protein
MAALAARSDHGRCSACAMKKVLPAVAASTINQTRLR